MGTVIGYRLNNELVFTERFLPGAKEKKMSARFKIHTPSDFASLEEMLANGALKFNGAIAGFVEGNMPEAWTIIWYYSRRGQFAPLSPSLHPGVHYHHLGGEGDKGLLSCLIELGHMLMADDPKYAASIKDGSTALVPETPTRFWKLYSAETATLVRKRREMLREVYPRGYSSMSQERNAQRRISAEELTSSCDRCSRHEGDYSSCELGCEAIVRYCTAVQ